MAGGKSHVSCPCARVIKPQQQLEVELDKKWNWTAPLLKGSTNSGQLITEDRVSHYDEVNMKMHSFMQEGPKTITSYI